MADYTVTGNVDMSTLDLATIKNGTIDTNNSTTLVITATDGTVYTLTGNFTGGAGSTLPTGGDITGWSSSATDGSTVDITGLDLSVKTFDHALNTDNATNLQFEMFGGNDNFDAAAGTGDDVLTGYAGNDIFRFGGSFGGSDEVNGGGGYNTVMLNGNYHSGLTLAANALTNVQDLRLIGDHSYDITASAGSIVGVHGLLVDASQVGPGQTVDFNGSAESVNFDFDLTSLTNSTIVGGSGNNTFNGGGKNDTLVGGAGNDRFFFGSQFDGTDSIDGGGGHNTVLLDGDYSAGLNFGANSLVNIQHLVLEGANSYNLTLNSANVTAVDTLTIVGHGLTSADSLIVNGAATSGNLIFQGGASTDNLTGGSGDNTFITGSGVETLTGLGAHDSFQFSSAANSTGPNFDTIDGFNALNDHFVLGTHVTGLDTWVTTGSLSAATFNADMSADLGSSQLTANHAVLFTPDAGTFAGDTFLVVDTNGQAGYTAGQDVVIELNGPTHLASLSTSNFLAHEFGG
ncbi:MAG: calcium-binding protein [Rhizomicrobium sp.]|jgi:hypothetical protein